MPLYDGLVGAGYPNPAFVYDVGQPRNFRGQVDDVFICDRALSKAEITRVIRDGATGLERAALIWTFDEGQEELVRDQSGNGCAGHLVAQPKWVAGKLGTAIDLNGEHDAIAAGKRLPLCADFAIGCWVKPGRYQLHTHTPDVIVRRSGWIRDGDRLTMRLHITSPAEFSDYALCLWAVPTPFSADRTRIETTAKDFIPVKNTAGEFHLVLLFDLEREMELVVNVQ